MGYEILVAFFLVVLAPIVVLGFVVYWALVSRERASIESTWEGYAHARDREYVPARGEWPNRTSPFIRWRDDDLRLELHVVGVEAGARTRLVGWPPGKLLGRLTVSHRRGAPEASAGIDDAAFCSAFRIASRPDGLAQRLLDARARRALLGFWQRDDVVLTYRRGKLTLEWPGRESNDARIDEAVRVMRELARSVDDAFRSSATMKSPAQPVTARTS